MAIQRRRGSPYYYYSFMYKGVVYTRSTRTKNKQKATQIELKAREELVAADMLGESVGISLENAVKRYLPTVKHSGSRRTIDSALRQVFIIIPRDTLLHEIKTKDISRLIQYLEQLGRKKGTQRNYLRSVRNVFNWASANGYTVPKDIEYPNVVNNSYRLRFLSHHEEKKLLEAMNPERKAVTKNHPTVVAQSKALYDFVVLLLNLGCRHTELAHLRWRDVDLIGKYVHLFRSKTNTEARLPLTKAAYGVLLSRKALKREDQVYVFEDKNGGPRKYSLGTFKNATRRAGLEGVSFHTLRHTVASRMAQAGMSLQEIGHFLGHRSVTTTERYAHLIPGLVDERAIQVLEGQPINQKYHTDPEILRDVLSI